MPLPSPQTLGFAYFLSEFLLMVTRRARVAKGEKQDHHTLRILWLVIGLSVASGLHVTSHWRVGAISHQEAFGKIALAMFVGGLVLRWWAILALGRFFTVDVQIATDHRVIENGPFAYVRHPSYAGALLAFAGFALSLGNWAACLVVMLPITIAFLHRIRIEESALTSGLGDRYVDYSRRTKRLLPGVY